MDIRVIAAPGAAAYLSALRADQQSRKAAGRQLSDNKRVAITAVARRQMLAGQVDSRLLTTLAALAAIHPLSVVAFGDSGPGVAPGVPLRAVELATTSQTVNADRPLTVQGMLALVNLQQPPFVLPGPADPPPRRRDRDPYRIRGPRPARTARTRRPRKSVTVLAAVLRAPHEPVHTEDHRI